MIKILEVFPIKSVARQLVAGYKSTVNEFISSTVEEEYKVLDYFDLDKDYSVRLAECLIEANVIYLHPEWASHEDCVKIKGSAEVLCKKIIELPKVEKDPLLQRAMNYTESSRILYLGLNGTTYLSLPTYGGAGYDNSLIKSRLVEINKHHNEPTRVYNDFEEAIAKAESYLIKYKGACLIFEGNGYTIKYVEDNTIHTDFFSTEPKEKVVRIVSEDRTFTLLYSDFTSFRINFKDTIKFLMDPVTSYTRIDMSEIEVPDIHEGINDVMLVREGNKLKLKVKEN